MMSGINPLPEPMWTQIYVAISVFANYISTSAFANGSYLMANVKAIFLYKNVLNTSQNAIIGRCWST